jgi:hypothetical protein
MKHLTKAQIIERLNNVSDDLRRSKRAINQLRIDLEPRDFIIKDFDHVATFNDKVDDVLKRSENEFNLNVTEPGGGGDSSRINTYIKSVEGIGWDWEKDYTRNGQFAWCGAFAAFCYNSARFNIRHKIFPSCYRMYNAWGNTTRKVKDIYTGDIVVVYTSSEQSPAYGNHITIALGPPDSEGFFETIEGNAKGYGPDGQYREGVSKRTRNVKDVAHIYRLASEDYDE